MTAISTAGSTTATQLLTSMALPRAPTNGSRILFPIWAKLHWSRHQRAVRRTAVLRPRLDLLKQCKTDRQRPRQTPIGASAAVPVGVASAGFRTLLPGWTYLSSFLPPALTTIWTRRARHSPECSGFTLGLRL